MPHSNFEDADLNIPSELRDVSPRGAPLKVTKINRRTRLFASDVTQTSSPHAQISLASPAGVDPFAGKRRSQIMSHIRGKNTRPERVLAAMLVRRGIRFRRHDTSVPGIPDFCFPEFRLAVFLDGDFWHGRPLRIGRGMPNTNREFWIRKLTRNAQRDLRVRRELRKTGWRCLRIWTSDFRRDRKAALRRILSRLK